MCNFISSSMIEFWIFSLFQEIISTRESTLITGVIQLVLSKQQFEN